MPNYFTNDVGVAQNELVKALAVFLIYSNAAPTVSTPHQLRAHVPLSRGPTAACAQCADNARQGHCLGTTSWQCAALDATRQLARSTASSAMQGNERSRHQ